MSWSWTRWAPLSQILCPDHQIYFPTEILSDGGSLSAQSSDDNLLFSPADGEMAPNYSKWYRNYRVTAGLSKNVLLKKKKKKKSNKRDSQGWQNCSVGRVEYRIQRAFGSLAHKHAVTTHCETNVFSPYENAGVYLKQRLRLKLLSVAGCLGMCGVLSNHYLTCSLGSREI